MECSLTCENGINGEPTFVLILILMECSLTLKKKKSILAEYRLNPYSNGMLSDNLKESVLDIFCFSSLNFNPFGVRELIPSEKIFAKVSKVNTHSK